MTQNQSEATCPNGHPQAGYPNGDKCININCEYTAVNFLPDQSEALDIPCYKCEKPDIKLVSRATWICQSCGYDNSLYYVLMNEAIEGEKL